MPPACKILYRTWTRLFIPSTETQEEKSEQADFKSSRQNEEQKNESSLNLQPPVQFPQRKAPTTAGFLELQLRVDSTTYKPSSPEGINPTNSAPLLSYQHRKTFAA